MPPVSLVVCLYKQGDLLQRLLENSAGCYDDLVVVHDGPDETGIRTIVETAHGRFFERPRECQQEPHWPFAWGQARHDWILRLDADEFPDEKMKEWLACFRQRAEPEGIISGYTCVWPLWNGRRALTQHWPDGRVFLFNRRQVRFVGIPEQSPVPDGRYQLLPLILHHRPARKSHGLSNILLRRQAFVWRRLIARALLGKPGDLPCWRWERTEWDEHWESVRIHPLRTGISRLGRGTYRGLRAQWKHEKRFFPLIALMGPLHHFLFCIEFWWIRRKRS